jgi:hypothetical protein
MMDQDKEILLLRKFFGLTGQLRKHQVAFFKYRTEFDKKKCIVLEKKLDDYIRLLIRNGIEPIIENDSQSSLNLK